MIYLMHKYTERQEESGLLHRAIYSTREKKSLFRLRSCSKRQYITVIIAVSITIECKRYSNGIQTVSERVKNDTCTGDNTGVHG